MVKPTTYHKPKTTKTNLLKSQYPGKSSRFIYSSINEFGNGENYDLIICNAVIQIAKNHKDVDIQFEKLISLLNSNAIIFIYLCLTSLLIP